MYVQVYVIDAPHIVVALKSITRANLTCLAKSLAEPRSSGFIFQLPAMKGTRPPATIWHTPCFALTRSCTLLCLTKPDDAPWKAVVGAMKADAAGTPASTSAHEDEVNFMVVGREAR